MMIFPDSTETTHPYLGYVLSETADARAWARIGWPMPNVNRFGFEGMEFDASLPPDTLRVGVFGGSVAKGLALSRSLERALNAHTSGRAAVFSCALNGYKQPQQLFLLMYLLALGLRWDVVINLDGFNEVALHEAENARQGIHPIYPRAWYARVSRGRDSIATRLSLLLHWADRLHGWCSAPRFASSALALPMRGGAKLAERIGRSVVRRLHRHLARANGHRLGDVARGPGRIAAPLDALYEELASIWYRSSRLMHRVCEAEGIGYYHALQPNQYVAGSKPMGATERRTAISEAHPYRLGVHRGYARLRAKGQLLTAAGVRFVDLTGLFQSMDDQVYADTCCHLNDLGNRLVGEALAAVVSGQAVESVCPSAAASSS